MDSNQTRFHLLLGRDNWARATDQAGSSILDAAAEPVEFSWDPARSELTLGIRANVFHSAPGNRRPSLGQRRGAAQDRYGNIYSIADSGEELLVNSSGTGATTHFWASPDEISQGCDMPAGTFGVCRPEAPPVPLSFSGLAVTEQHYLVAGVLEPAGFVVFDLFHGGPPRQFVWPSAIPFVPFELAAAPGGGVWILDRANHHLWALDRTFAVIRQDQDQVALNPGPRDVFSPADGTAAPARPTRTFPAGISLDLASPLGSIDAIGLAALPDGSVLLLESDPLAPFSLIYRLHYGQRLGTPVSLASVLDLLAPEDRTGFTLLGHDFAFIAVEQTPFGQRQNILYVASQNGDQAWAFTAAYGSDQLALSPMPEFYPMRLFGGRALAAGTSQVYYDSETRWVPLIVQQRPRYAVEGTLFTPVLDGKQPDCVWHKLILDVCVPSDTSIQVWSRAHNDKQYLEIQSFLPEPGPYPRQDGSELPWVPETPGLDAWELLFQRALGRYLQLQIVLSGNGKLTPRIRALRAYYPRFSYRDHYLPAVYRENQQSASFVERFLANIEGFFTSIEDKIATVQTLLDPRSAPADALDWLANWFGVALDPAWTESKRRLFLRHAAQFFEARGTLPGLTMALRLTLEDCADESVFTADPYLRTGLRIVEKFRTRRLPAGLFDEATNDTGLPVKLRTGIWTPSQGADELDRRYRETLALPAGAAYPIALSAADALFASWNRFSIAALGFTPSHPDSGNADLWTAFLRSRYGSIGALNSAYNATYASFGQVPFPQVLPRQPQGLLDWYQFQGVLLIDAAAHQFAVYLPMPAADAQNTIAHRAKMNLAKRVLDLEKPAHSTYEIKFYWAFFRVGDARLGEDSVLDRGSRAPQLLLPAVLGDTYAGSTFISRERPGEPRVRPFLKPRSC